ISMRSSPLQPHLRVLLTCERKRLDMPPENCGRRLLVLVHGWETWSATFAAAVEEPLSAELWAGCKAMIEVTAAYKLASHHSRLKPWVPFRWARQRRRKVWLSIGVGILYAAR